MSERIRYIVVLDLLIDPDKLHGELPDALRAIHAEKVPHFGGSVRVAVDDPDGEQVASKVIAYLENEGVQL